MRLREPFAGFKLASGHGFVHLAMLIANYQMIDTEDILNDGKIEKKEADAIVQQVNITRYVHVICILLQIFQIIFQYAHMRVMTALAQLSQIFLFLGSILFVQQRICNQTAENWQTAKSLTTALLWLTFEVAALYLYIFSAIFYLLMTTLKGEFASHKTDLKGDRYKYDAMNYYKADLDWFAFIFIGFVMDSFVIFLQVSGKYGIQLPDGQKGGSTDEHLTYITIGLRIFQFFSMRDLYDKHRYINRFPNSIWVIQGLIYLYINLYMYFNKETHPLLRSIAYFDTIMSFFQFLLYLVYINFHSHDCEDNGGEDQTVAPIPKEQRTTWSRITSIIKKKTKEWEVINFRTGGVQKSNIGLQEDIYSFAFASFIDPDKINEGAGLLERIPMNDDEITGLYLGALLVIAIQLGMMSLIMVYEITSPNFKIEPAKDYTIIIARFISYYMMHLNVEPEIRNGLILGKYCVNHPGIFKNAYYADSNGKRRINLMAVLPPFSLAFGQASIALIVEINVLIFLTSMQSLLSVIMSFAALNAICKFDDMYAQALYETKMLECGGAQMEKKYCRSMKFMMEKWQQENEHKKKEVDDIRFLDDKSDTSVPDFDGDEDKVDEPFGYIDGKPFYRNPRDGSIPLQLMRGIIKAFRVIYVAIIYYFMPFFFTFITFIGSVQLLQPEFQYKEISEG